jgi:hypothetical protein
MKHQGIPLVPVTIYSFSFIYTFIYTYTYEVFFIRRLFSAVSFAALGGRV